MSKVFVICVTCALSITGCSLIFKPAVSKKTRGADWPMWRYDAGRTAASPAQLPADLHLQWKRQLPPPRPAFPDEPRMCFDTSYEPVVTGGKMFVGSMVTDSVMAIDTDTGAEIWKFYTECHQISSENCKRSPHKKTSWQSFSQNNSCQYYRE